MCIWKYNKICIFPFPGDVKSISFQLNKSLNNVILGESNLISNPEITILYTFSFSSSVLKVCNDFYTI